MRTIRAADLFCGAGGTSTGLAQACQAIGAKLDLTAVNHWPVAVETHAANHPEARHLCETLDGVDPRKTINGRLDLLVASPECTHHSNARGGKPMSDQSRSSAWHVVRWAEALRPSAIIIENVREFQTWGPLNERGRPLKRRKGEIFQAWLTAIRSLGYTVGHALLNAADFGDPTTRERLFVLAVRNKPRLPWPDKSHCREDSPLFGSLPRWRPAREIIDWSIPGQSIFKRKRPLSDNTMRRIAAGIKKFCGNAFIVPQFGEQGPRDLDRPAPTITTTSRGIGLAQPFIADLRGTEMPERSAKSIDSPLSTITSSGNHHALIEAFIMQMSQSGSNGSRTRSVSQPVATITTADDLALVEPFIIPTNHGNGDTRSHSIDNPMPTITSVDAWGLIEPFLVKYNRTASAQSLAEPLDTVTVKDRFGLVNGTIVDIRFRMLQPHELAAAMSFPSTYKFAGNREQRVKQIGNAVPVKLAQALCAAAIGA